MSGSFLGKYRGVVSDVTDPMMLGRLRARVADVTGQAETGWAMPCAPFGGDGMGFFAVPKVGAGVWIEFEHGDPDYPIWTGCWWGASSERPSVVVQPGPGKVMLKTENGHSILLDDTPGSGGIVLETSDGAKISVTGQGIEITNGQGAKLSLSGPKTTLNDGALEVM